MCLYPFTVIFCLKVEWTTMVSKKVDVLFPCQHRSYRTKKTNLIIQRHLRVLELLAGLQQAVSQVKVIIRVLVVCIQHRLQFYTQLQVLQDDTNYPFYFFGAAFLKQLTKYTVIISI